MTDILAYLVENYHDFSSHPKPDDLALKLSAVGFEGLHISVALDRLARLKELPAAEFAGDSRSPRICVIGEQQKLGVECQSFISFHKSAGVITPPLRGLIIKRGMALQDDPVRLGKFKIVVLMVLWSREQSLEPLIAEELLNETEPERLH